MRALALIGVVAAAGCEKKFNEEYCIKHGDDPAYAAYCHGDANTIDAVIPDGPPGTHRLIGAVNGLLAGMLVLQNNGGDDVTRTMDGAFYFPTALPMGAPYNVTVKTQPSPLTCSVANGSGTMQNEDISNVDVHCIGDLGIKCGTSYCAVGSFCCFGANTCGSCATTEHITCDDTADCSGAVGTICCGRFTGGGNTVKDAVCLQLSDCMANMGGYEILCDPDAPGGDPACTGGTPSCKGASKFIGYNSCQP